MYRRSSWLLFALVLPLYLLFAGIYDWGRAQETAVSSHSLHAPFDLIINEWSQGHGGSKEWVELLVVNGPLDLRGWQLDDANAGSSLTFADAPLWQSVPNGTVLVVYNGNDPDDILPDDDANADDCTLVVAHNDSAHFSGGWPAFANSTDSDNPIVRDSSGATVHDYSTAPGGSHHPGAHENAQYEGATTNGVGNGDNWRIQDAGSATPGLGNGGDNTEWVQQLCGDGGVPETADLTLSKSAPTTIPLTGTLRYTITVGNQGALTATGVLVTDTLPPALIFAGDDGRFPRTQPDSRTLVWALGDVATDTAVSLPLTTTLVPTASGAITNQVRAATTATETNTANNEAIATTAIRGPSTILIDAVLYDGYETGDADEAVALRNVGGHPVAVDGWQLSDGWQTAVLPTLTVTPSQTVWLARDNLAFTRQFGFAPDAILADWPGFSNSGDEVLLYDAASELIDALVYDGGAANAGWHGATVAPYRVSSLFGVEGQILYRRRDPATGQPVADTDQAQDWAQWDGDPVLGRKVRYPGWDLDRFFLPAQVTETATSTLAITLAATPDAGYETLLAAIDQAQESIQIETMTFGHVALAEALIRAQGRGVSVTLLLEGAPPGGLADQEKYVCQQLDAAGITCWFMINDDDQSIHDRYRFLHAKFAIIDGQTVAISSENFGPESFPTDTKDDGTWGRRGLLLITDAPGVVARVQSIFDHDLDLAHQDLFPWQDEHPTYGPPPVGFQPITATGGITYTARHSAPLQVSGTFPFAIVQAPENSLRPGDGVLGLATRVGSGDTLLVQQLAERPYWGPSTSNPTADPNPRLEAYLDAARRGATVRLLLDQFFDDAESATGNAATCAYVNAIAQAEGLSLRCAQANPTGLGIHNKMILAQIDGAGYVHLGSLNGTEQSNKGNRELVVQFQSDAAYHYLADMFTRDWPHRVYLPLTLHNYIGPADHVLISEVLYDPAGPDDSEFVEIVNPRGSAMDISGYSLSDAVARDDFEDTRRFPAGTILSGRSTLVIATGATAFQAEFGVAPDFEILDTDAAVPTLVDDTNWGDPGTFLQLGNDGDEVILRDTADQPVDVITYGTGSFPGVIECTLVAAPQRSLERFPYWRDTDNCAADFRDWPFPNPGAVP